jgi:circadian clock protein KaiC
MANLLIDQVPHKENPNILHEADPSLALPKTPTGIAGFDAVTLGGLPTGRPTLICGEAGSGKTLFASTFLVHGATQFGEPGVFMSFEERAGDLSANVRSLGYDFEGLIADRQLIVDHVRIARSEIEETGEYDLEGLFVRLGFAVDTIGAKRVVLDTIESLFSAFIDVAILRAELRRLFGWIKDRGLTAIITGERGEGQLTRHGLEEYVSDCVIVLDNRVEDQIATRRLRIVKYRGSSHGTNEYPFLIDENGISVVPATLPQRSTKIFTEVIPTGIPGLDAMLRSGGFYRGSSILVSGGSGTGKTTVASHLVEAACRRDERCIVFALEESAGEFCRNALSVGIDLQQRITAGLLQIEATRPSFHGLEMHLARMYRDVEAFKPAVVVIDPISAFRGPTAEIYSTLLRMVDMLKGRNITAMVTSLRSGESLSASSEQDLSSLMDSWIRLMDIEANGERNHALYIIKSRGMSHSNQVREYRMTDTGIDLIDAYIGPEGVLTGTARLVQEARERAAADRRVKEAEQHRRQLARRREAVVRQIAELQASLDEDADEQKTLSREEEAREAVLASDRVLLATRRGAAE